MCEVKKVLPILITAFTFCFLSVTAQPLITKAHISVTSSNGLFNETIVAFIEDATVGFDEQYDVIKLIANPNIALYSFIENEKYAIQALPPIESETVVKLGMICLPQFSQQLKVTQFENFQSGEVMLLRDLELNQTVVMNLNSTYDFTVGSMNLDQRFELIFLPNISINATSETCAGNDGKLFLRNATQFPGTLQVKNITFNNPQFTISNFAGDTLLSNLIYGEYQILFSDNFGRNQNELTEIEYGYAIEASIWASSDTVFKDSLVTFFSAINVDVFSEWDFGDNSPFSNLIHPSHSYSDTGLYTVRFRCTNSFCTVFDSLKIYVRTIPDTLPQDTTIIDTLGINTQQALSKILMYPNPFNQSFQIQGLDELKTYEIAVFAVDSRACQKTFTLQTNTLNLDLSELRSGCYFIKITEIDSGKFTLRKMIKN